MGFSAWGYYFDGPYSNPNKLQKKAGVYLIICQVSYEKCNYLDVGESDDVKNRVKNHKRSDCSNSIYYSATYIPKKAERLKLEKKIRNSEDIACAER